MSFAEMKRIEHGLSLFQEISVLLVWGMLDPVIPTAVLRRWQQVYPQAKTYKLEDASHFLQEDAPEGIVRWIEGFCSG